MSDVLVCDHEREDLSIFLAEQIVKPTAPVCDMPKLARYINASITEWSLSCTYDRSPRYLKDLRRR